MLFSKTLELEQKVKTLEENKKNLDLTCFKLNTRNNEFLNKVKELKEHPKKSFSTLVQGSKNLNFFSKGKECSRRGLRFYSKNAQPLTYTRGPKNAYTKGKGKANVFS